MLKLFSLQSVQLLSSLEIKWTENEIKQYDIYSPCDQALYNKIVHNRQDAQYVYKSAQKW